MKNRRTGKIMSCLHLGFTGYMTIVLFLVFLSGTATGSAPEKTVMKAGVARVVISNKTPRIMVNKVTSQGILHDIYARALVLNDGENRLIFVTYDLNGLDVATPILRKRVKDELGVNPSNLILLATHNHLAPINSLPENFDFGRELADRMFGLIREAIAGEKGPVKVNFGFGNGYFVRSSDGPADYEIQVLKVVCRGKPMALLFNQPTHPVRATTNQIDPGHPGYAMDEIEARYPGAIALYGDACGGNQNIANLQGVPGTDKPLERTKAYGHILAQHVIKIAESPMTDVTGPIQSSFETVSLPLAPHVSYEEALELSKKYPKDAGFVPTGELEATNWVRMMLHYYEKHMPFPKRTGEMICTYDAFLINKSDQELLQKYSESINTDYPNVFEQVIVSRIGNMAFVAMQGEVCAPIGMRIKDAFRRDIPIMVTAYMGEQNLYIPTRELVRKKAYQGIVIQTQFASPTGWAPEVEDEMVDAVIQMTRSMMKDLLPAGPPPR
jgi:neutral ceramidase